MKMFREEVSNNSPSCNDYYGQKKKNKLCQLSDSDRHQKIKCKAELRNEEHNNNNDQTTHKIFKQNNHGGTSYLHEADLSSELHYSPKKKKKHKKAVNNLEDEVATENGLSNSEYDASEPVTENRILGELRSDDYLCRKAKKKQKEKKSGFEYQAPEDNVDHEVNGSYSKKSKKKKGDYEERKEEPIKLKKSKKHKHQELETETHTNISLERGTKQDNSLQEDQLDEQGEKPHKKRTKRKHNSVMVDTLDDNFCENRDEDAIVHKKKKKKKNKTCDTVEETGDCDYFDINKLTENSLNYLYHSDTAKAESVFNDTFTLDVLDEAGVVTLEKEEPVTPKKSKKHKHQEFKTKTDISLTQGGKAHKKWAKKHNSDITEDNFCENLDEAAIVHKNKKKSKICDIIQEAGDDFKFECSSSHSNHDTGRPESVFNETFTLDGLKVEASTDNDNEDDDMSVEKNHARGNNVKHSTNSQYCGIQNIIEEGNSYDERLNEPELHKTNGNNLVNMFVTVPWPVPRLHLVETRVAGRPTKEQRKQIEETGEEIKVGGFNKNEDKQIMHNWTKFCEVHDLPETDPTPFLNFGHSKGPSVIPTEERIKFVRFLAHGLNNRLLCSVYKRFQRLFIKDKIKAGRFSAEEDSIIMEYMHKHSQSTRTPYSDLAKSLNRDRLAVEKRFKILESKSIDGTDVMRWKEENIEEFLKHFLRITKSDSLSNLKDREIQPKEWKKLSKKLNLPCSKLRRAWFCTIHPQLFITTVESDVIKVDLLKKLIEKKSNDWRTVNWEAIAKDFEGFTGPRLNKLFKETVRYHVPADMRNNLKDCLKYLEKMGTQKKIFNTRRFKKLDINEVYLNGSVKYCL